jgi:hypothetical protein
LACDEKSLRANYSKLSKAMFAELVDYFSREIILFGIRPVVGGGRGGGCVRINEIKRECC